MITPKHERVFRTLAVQESTAKAAAKEAAKAKRAREKEERAAIKREEAAAKKAAKEAARLRRHEELREEDRKKRTRDLETTETFAADPRARTLSIDLAKVAGYALWQGRRLVEVGEVRPASKYLDRPWHAWDRVVVVGDKVVTHHFANERAAWASLQNNIHFHDGQLVSAVEDVRYVVFEGTYPRFAGAALDLGKRRGRVEVYLGLTDNNEEDTGAPPHHRMFSVDPNEWRAHVSKRIPGFVWVSEGRKSRGDKTGERHKAIALRVVHEQFQRQLGKRHDIAEAVLVGWWFMSTHMRTKTPGGES